jgi:hypothetical protein
MSPSVRRANAGRPRRAPGGGRTPGAGRTPGGGRGPGAGRGPGGGRARRAGPLGRPAWLAPPIGAALIVGLASAASLAQATEWIFLAASLVFSLCEGFVLAVVGYTWSRRGVGAAMLAAAVTAVVAAPIRWEVAIYTRRGLTAPQPIDLLSDLLVSFAWGALAGAASATVLHRKLGALVADAEGRFRPRR